MMMRMRMGMMIITMMMIILMMMMISMMSMMMTSMIIPVLILPGVFGRNSSSAPISKLSPFNTTETPG